MIVKGTDNLGLDLGTQSRAKNLRKQNPGLIFSNLLIVAIEGTFSIEPDYLYI